MLYWAFEIDNTIITYSDTDDLYVHKANTLNSLNNIKCMKKTLNLEYQLKINSMDKEKRSKRMQTKERDTRSLINYTNTRNIIFLKNGNIKNFYFVYKILKKIQ